MRACWIFWSSLWRIPEQPLPQNTSRSQAIIHCSRRRRSEEARAPPGDSNAYDGTFVRDIRHLNTYTRYSVSRHLQLDDGNLEQMAGEAKHYDSANYLQTSRKPNGTKRGQCWRPRLLNVTSFTERYHHLPTQLNFLGST